MSSLHRLMMPAIWCTMHDGRQNMISQHEKQRRMLHLSSEALGWVDEASEG